jgi:very-short-patch-repair endonuclease
MTNQWTPPARSTLPPSQHTDRSQPFGAPLPPGFPPLRRSRGETVGATDVDLGALSAASPERFAAVEAAANQWASQLVDLTGRNNLLYFRDLKLGTMDLESAPEDALLDVLAGRPIRLKRLVPDPDARLLAARRARTIHNRAQEHFEERGLETLFLACGTATWTSQRSSATPAAPVLLCPARLVPIGAAQDEFELSITGDAEVNQALLHIMDVDFGVRCDPEELLSIAGIDGAIDTVDELEVAFRWLTNHAAAVQGFSIEPRFVLATFAYAKLPMVKDLADSVEAMVGHDLIAALAGDPAAQAAIRHRRAPVEVTAPNHVPPGNEFLVLDADASQNYAINKVLAGQDLVVKGPPGTGKSQTIANLISTLVAHGRRVLFVAEKRAAIEAVLRRLDDVGLADLVLDLHGGTASKREIAQHLTKSLDTNASIARPDLEVEHRRLVVRREELNGHVESLHCVRKPWDVTLFAAHTRLIELGERAATPVRFRGRDLGMLTAAVHRQAQANLRDYVGRGGLAIASDERSPWSKARIVSSEHAMGVQRLLDRLATRTLPESLQRLHDAARATGLRPATRLSEWSQHVAVWQAVAAVQETFEAELWSEPLNERVPTLYPLAGGAGARMAAAIGNGQYRAARKRIRSLLRPDLKLPAAKLHQRLSEASECRDRWDSLAADGTIPSVPDDLEALVAALGAANDDLEQLAAHLGSGKIDGRADDVQGRVGRLRADTATLARLPQLAGLKRELHAVGLEPFLSTLSSRTSVADALAALEHTWLQSIVEHVRLSDTRVGGFDGAQHARTVDEFRAADRRHVRTTAQRVRRLVAEQAVAAEDEYEEQATLIRSQAARKRGHRSVRDLFRAAPEMLTALKPCWAMSPLVVSPLLPSNRPYFDVVIFDEASQVRPAEAMPAILRGRSVVVAGDEQQLPPTAFFASSDADGQEMEGRVTVDAGFESILEAMLPFIDSRMLGWHYRSRDERLIAFSNAHLYDKSMTTFPGVSGPETLKHVLVPFQRGRPGSEDSASAEVERVVELILEHAEERPEQSLGVIAMGIKHADRIEVRLWESLRDRPELNDFFNETRPERFFVKNLERVQGDERDAIILTVGYGKSSDGRMLYRFGPLNQEGGERRLNVAVTRAKARMTLVSSFSSADLDPDRTTARGAELLRLYLQYAECGGQRLDRQAREAPELNAFEIDIRDALTRAGIPLVCQHGASGFRIDFAAKHPTQPGRLVLAIEADGASYHSSATARDRDRLRQDHLERLGWRFHRIWSYDWFSNRESEIAKAVAAYQHAVAASEAPPPERPVLSDAEPRHDVVPSRGPRPPVFTTGRIDDLTDNELRAIVRWVESDTLLRTEDALVAEVMRACGFERCGRKIVDRITEAIRDVRGIPRSVPEPAPRNVAFSPSRIALADIEVVGESFYMDALRRIVGADAARTDMRIRVPVQATLVPEPGNPYDRNAVAVHVRGHKVAYLARTEATRYQRAIQALPGRRVSTHAQIVGSGDRLGVSLKLPDPRQLQAWVG